LHSELDRYLGTDPEHVTDALAWWYEHKHVYPRLHRMALDYLSIPGTFSNPNVLKLLNHQCILATSVDVERTFSQGRLLLSHIRNRLSVQSTRALLCLGIWSEMGYVKDKDVKAATVLPEVGSDEEEDDLGDDWDAI
jgi:hAT family C-terminal dimerisation region